MHVGNAKVLQMLFMKIHTKTLPVVLEFRPDPRYSVRCICKLMLCRAFFSVEKAPWVNAKIDVCSGIRSIVVTANHTDLTT